MPLFSSDIGIDLGTATVLVYVKGKGVVLNEPSVVAVDKVSGKILAVGEEAQKHAWPYTGQHCRHPSAARGRYFGLRDDRAHDQGIHRKGAGLSTCSSRMWSFACRRIITEVEERAVIDAGTQAGAKRVFLVEEPVAAAIGAGIDINRPNGNLVVDIGGGTTDVAVISLGGIVESTSIKVAGDKFDEAIVKYVRRKHNALIGDRTAEEIKTHGRLCVSAQRRKQSWRSGDAV